MESLVGGLSELLSTVHCLVKVCLKVSQAPKTALVALLNHEGKRFVLLDVQSVTEHLKCFAVEISFKEILHCS